VVGSQIANLIIDPSFGHILCFKYPNESCEPTLDIYVPRPFWWCKEMFNSMNFDSYNRLLKVQKSIGTLTPKVGIHLGVWGFIPSHIPTLMGAWNVTPGLHSWPTSFATTCLHHKLKVKVATHVTFLHFKRSMSSLISPLWSQLEHNPQVHLKFIIPSLWSIHLYWFLFFLTQEKSKVSCIPFLCLPFITPFLNSFHDNLLPKFLSCFHTHQIHFQVP